MAEKSKQSKSIFLDDKFKYVKVPVEILRLPDLVKTDILILSRVAFWTNRGMPCTHTNEQFAELTGKTSSAAKRSIRKLLKRKYLAAFRKNKRARDLTALRGIAPADVIKRMAAQALRNSKSRGSPTPPSEGHQRPPKSQKEGHQRPPTTTENKTKNNYRPPKPTPAKGQAPAALSEQDERRRAERRERFESSLKERKRQREERERLSELEIENRKQKARKALLAMT